MVCFFAASKKNNRKGGPRETDGQQSECLRWAICYVKCVLRF